MRDEKMDPNDLTRCGWVRGIFIWAPNNSWQSKANPAHCRASVHDPHGWGSHQCTRKPTTTIDGFGFCTQHAKQARPVNATPPTPTET